MEQPAFTAKNLIIPFSTDSQTFFQPSVDGQTARLLATDSCNFSGCRSDERTSRRRGERGRGRGEIMATPPTPPYANVGGGAVGWGDSPIVENTKRNEIQLTNCSLASCQTSDGRVEGERQNLHLGRGWRACLTRERHAERGRDNTDKACISKKSCHLARPPSRAAV